LEGVRLGKPREPSVWGMMIISFLTGLALAENIDIWGTLIALTGLIVTLATFDSIMDSLRLKRRKTWIVLIMISSTPYLVGLAYWGSPIIIPIVAASSLILFHLSLSMIAGWKNPVTYIVGAAIPVLPFLVTPTIASGGINSRIWIAWILLSLYAMTTAAYVETRLSFRQLDPRVPLLVWIPSIASIIYSPILIIALVEPTAKVLSNLRSRRLVNDGDEIKRMGWIELGRILLFSILLIIILRFFLT